MALVLVVTLVGTLIFIFWRLGATATNYQLMPGDRVFVQAYPLVSIDTAMARFLAPLERTFGIALLGSSTVYNLQNGGQGGNQGGFFP